MSFGHVSESVTFLGISAVIHSSPMRELMKRVERVACSSATVLITGETGSGKEVVARALHCYSARARQPWVDVSCAAVPEHLLESELFGHEKGAFSSADAFKPGLFEIAHTGTLFLDEIGELNPRLQTKLLRVLDGVPYYRLGGVRKVMADVRIIAATNQDLEKATLSGLFRSDLFHRLNQVTLHVPPLRERREDILPIALFFLRNQAPELRLAAETAAMLQSYSWPGNVRQLKNVMINVALNVDGPEIRPRHLPAEITLFSAGAYYGSLAELERRSIYEALAHFNGHRQRAAGQLGISSRTLTRKLKTYKLREVQLAS